MKFCQRGLEGSPLLLAEWKCVPDDSLSCLSNPELRRMAPWTNFSFDILQFLSLRNFCPGGRILLFNTSFGNLRTRALVLDHKKGVFKHFKWLKTADAATADLIRVVLAQILDFLCNGPRPLWFKANVSQMTPICPWSQSIMALGHLEHISIELIGFGRQMHEIWPKCLLERSCSKVIGGDPHGLDCL